jgi:hypothetical protein
MARIPPLSRSLSGTIPFARGVADRAVTTAGPIVVGLVGRVASHLPGRMRTEPSRPETFTPSRHIEEPAAEPVAREVAAAPSPATVARNVAGPRPTAKAPARSKPRSAPGAKLPVRRPRAST